MVALFVGDLHPEVSELMLLNRFILAGPIQSVRVCKNRKTGSPLGYAFVNFYNRDDAERAIKMFNFGLLLERPMRVTWARWEPRAKMINRGNIIIKNLDVSIDDVALFDTFSVFGRIMSCKVVESKGYGYIQYEAAEAAAMAIQQVNGMFLKGRQVTIEYFKCWEEHKMEECKVEECTSSQNRGNNLYIKNLDTEAIDTECLYTTFVQFGTITSAKVMMENGSSKGFGFVSFTSPQDAMTAMKAMNGLMWGRKPVYVGLAQRREERQAHLQRMFSQQFNTTLELHQPPVLTSCFNTSSPVVEMPHSEDLVQTVAASASEDTVPAATERAATTPLDTEETVEASAPEGIKEAVETNVSEDTVERTPATLEETTKMLHRKNKKKKKGKNKRKHSRNTILSL